MCSSASAPKCYNTSNPDLNSTAWFVDYISVFLSFITLDDLLLFGSIQVWQHFEELYQFKTLSSFIHSCCSKPVWLFSFSELNDMFLFQPFTVNLENLQLFSQISVPDDVMDFYVTELFKQNPSFSAY